MKTSDTDIEILNLINELENKEISWEEYKLKLKNILDSKNNNLTNEKIKKEDHISASIISEDKVKLEKNQPIEVEPEPIPQPKTPYHCESKVTPDGIQTFCIGNPEAK